MTATIHQPTLDGMPDIPEPPRPFELGERVTFRRGSELRRRTKRRPLKRHGILVPNRFDSWRVWEKMDSGERVADHVRIYFDEVRAGVVVGLRTLSDGIVDGSYDEPTTYTSMETHAAAIVATSLRSKPVMVLLEDVIRHD